tara:strand:+ start:314 stop:850 length:537 start_codon:yes stop_codon:yes gene_type:complete
MKDTFGYFNVSEFKGFLDSTLPIEKFKKVLEIGSYEGIFTCYAASVFADVVHTVDPFDVSDEGTNVTENVESNFNSNISNCPSGNKIISHKMFSDNFFAKNNDVFDLIYVDGSHEPEDVIKDLNNSFDVCKIGGIIWVDDYGSNYKTLHETIDMWLNDHQQSIDIIHKGYQVGFTKLK